MYSNVNGREEKLEREFDNPQDFQSFAGQVPAFQIFNRLPSFGRDGITSLHNYFENLLDRRLGLGYQEQEPTDSLVDLHKYEDALQHIDYQKAHKEEHVKQLKTTLQKLKDYKKKFKEEQRDDIISQLDADIQRIEDELKKSE